MDLSSEQKLRYERQTALEGFGLKAQKKLLKSKVLIVGAGGLGSASILYLAGAGIGNIGIADNDKVDISNLPRQIIHNTGNIGTQKTKSAKQAVTILNPDVKITTYNEQIDAQNAAEIFNEYDFIIDATDNPKTKFIINQVCIDINKPFSYGGINRYMGQTTTIIPGKSPCLACLFGDMIPEIINNHEDKIPVFNTVPGIIGNIQATECIKFLTNLGELLCGELIVFETKQMRFNKILFNTNPACNICSNL